MKKLAIACLISLVSLSAFAQELTCLDKLLPFSRHSGLHMLTKEEWTDTTNGLNPENAKIAFETLLNRKLMCRTNEVTIAIQPVCTQILADMTQSNVCYLHTNVGYFVLSRDNVKNVNFIFSRDKLFSDTH